MQQSKTLCVLGGLCLEMTPAVCFAGLSFSFLFPFYDITYYLLAGVVVRQPTMSPSVSLGYIME